MNKMNNSKLFLGSIIIPGVLAILTTGCATKKYVIAQIAPVNAKLGALETNTNQNVDNEQHDISRVEEKLLTADNQIRETAATAQEANILANQANDLAKQDQTAIAVNRTADQAALAMNVESIARVGKAMTYSLVAEGEVEFSFDKSGLTPVGRDKLDTLLQQVSSKQRLEFELDPGQHRPDWLRFLQSGPQPETGRLSSAVPRQPWHCSSWYIHSSVFARILTRISSRLQVRR